MKKLFFVLLISLVLLSGCVCPPSSWEGPWPPWCDQIKAGDLPSHGPTIEQSPAEGTPLKISFEAVLPRTQNNVSVIVDGIEHPMNVKNEYWFEGGEIDVNAGDTINYYFSDGINKTKSITKKITATGTIREGLPWTGSEKYAHTGFIKGHTVMDGGGYIVNDIKTGRIGSTQDAMIDDGAEWFAYDYYWGYDDTKKPSIINQVEENENTFMKDSDLVKLAQGTHNKGLKLMLITELEWIITQDIRDSYGDWDEFMEYQDSVWKDGGNFLDEMGRKIEENSNNPEAKKFWDDWFVEYEEFMLYSAEYAEKNNVELLVIGKQLAGAMNPGLENKWRDLISKVRTIYHGKIAQAPFVNQYTNLEYMMPWVDDLDYVIIYYYSEFSKEEKPSIETLKKAMDKFNDEQFDPIYEKYGTKMIFLTPFQSRDYAAKQEWFEPMSSGTGVGLDLEAQADLYEAFFESTIDEEWFAGLMTWGYWTNEDTGLPTAFEKSSTVRGKPASLVIRKWFSQIQN